jgi:aminoglycoside 2''-phosphotransferase
MIYDETVEPLLARIREVYPDLVTSDAQLVSGHGQNNQILIVDERLIFRFPRYVGGIARLMRTTRILRAIRTALPLEIPDPTYSSFDEAAVGKAFVGYPLIRGEPLWTEAFERLPDEGIRQRVVDQLAVFLRALHDVPVNKVLTEAVVGFDPLAEWRDLYDRIRLRLFPAMRPDARQAVSRHFELFLGNPASRQIRPALVHGDFGTSNILYDPDTGNVVGVIDFDSTDVGDPAVDFAAASCYGLQRFARVYPEVSAMANRVNFYRGTFALQEALFGAENGDDVAYRAGMAAYVGDC